MGTFVFVFLYLIVSVVPGSSLSWKISPWRCLGGELAGQATRLRKRQEN
jgi:hypothetical protein